MGISRAFPTVCWLLGGVYRDKGSYDLDTSMAGGHGFTAVRAEAGV